MFLIKCRPETERIHSQCIFIPIPILTHAHTHAHIHTNTKQTQTPSQKQKGGRDRAKKKLLRSDSPNVYIQIYSTKSIIYPKNSVTI